jgi:signal transduction histidine kinase
VEVVLAQRGDVLELLVRDDGCGMDPQPADSGGLGLRSMRERAQQMGGSLTFGRSPLGGVEVRLRVPGVALQNATPDARLEPAHVEGRP